MSSSTEDEPVPDDAWSSLFGTTLGSAPPDTSAMFTSLQQYASIAVTEIAATATAAMDSTGASESELLFTTDGIVVPNGAKKDKGGIHARQAFEEEISCMEDLLKSKDLDNAKLSQELQETKAAVQAEKLMQINMKKEFKETRAIERAATDKLEEKLGLVEKELVHVRNEMIKYQKLAEDRSTEVNSLQKQLGTLVELKKELKTAKTVETAMKDSYEDKISTMEREMSDLREELQNTVEERTSIVSSLQKQLTEACGKVADTAGSHDADVAQLQQERVAARLEASQCLEQLKQAKDQASTLEKKLEKAKSLQRKVEDKLKASERNRQALEDDAKNASAEASTEVASLKERIAGLESELTLVKTASSVLQEVKEKHSAEIADKLAQMDALAKALAKAQESLDDEKSQLMNAQQEMAKLTIRLEGTESEIATLKKTNKSLQEARGKQSTEALTIASKTDELALALKKSEEALALEKSQSAVVAKARDDLKASMTAKETMLSEQQGKTKELSEKLKDVMKNYAEAKASLKSLEHNKDAELAALRLKLEHVERDTGDQRTMAADMADRYGDTQRELSRAKTAIEEHRLTIDSLQRDQRAAEEQISIVTNEKAMALEKLRVAEEARMAFERRITELLEEHEKVEDKLRQDEDSAKVLEEYKKRAQSALKKANSASSAAASEVAEMKRAMEEADARTTEAEVALANKEERCRHLQEELEKAQELIKQLKNEMATAVAAEQSATAASEYAFAQLQDANAALARAQESKPEAVAPVVVNPVVLCNRCSSPLTEENTKIIRSAGGSSDREGAMASTTETAAQSSAVTKGGRQQLEYEEDEEVNEENAVTSTIGRRTGQSLRHGKSPTPPPQQYQQQNSEPPEYGDNLNLTAKKPSSDKLMLHNEVTNHPNNNTFHPIGTTHLTTNMSITPSSCSTLCLFPQLYAQIEELRRQVAQRGVEVQASRQDLLAEVDAKVFV